MNTKKILAVAAVTLLAVPAMAAASQIVVPSVQEEVVEGHTVFAVIEKTVRREAEQQAAAVAVLVREREIRENRIKGVLWFNDQYLTTPFNSERQSVRYPCGGAVIAVNAGDPDPRTMLVSYNGTDVYQTSQESYRDNQDVQSYDEDYNSDVAFIGDGNESQPSTRPSGDEDQTQSGPGTTTSSGASNPNDYNSWANLDDPDGLTNTPANGGSLGTLTTATPTSFDYVESYLITDPNDHSWIIDKYEGVTLTSVNLDTQATSQGTARFPIWVVNILGKPGFTPDDGYMSCGPFVDDPWQQGAINSQFANGDDFTCGVSSIATTACPSDEPGFNRGDADGDGTGADGLDGRPPALGYYEPTDEDYDGADPGAQYCYDGNAAQGDNADRREGSGCDHGDSWMPTGAGDPFFGHIDPAGRDRYQGPNPLRIYNALLYFYLGADDVAITDSRAHVEGETNGCQAGTEWQCPNGDDDAEGYSHPFNPPGVYVPRFAEPTADGGQGPDHGGYWLDIHKRHTVGRTCDTGYDSTAKDPNGDSVCNPEEHETHDRGLIDLYFSPVARPLEPAFRVFAERDTDGRMDPFHENNCPDREDPNDVDGDGITAEPDGQCDPRPHKYHPGQPDYDMPSFPSDP